jgi:general secretion pathway protein G
MPSEQLDLKNNPLLPTVQNRASALGRRAAFTLIELLVVIAVISILAGLTIATVGGVQKNSARNKAKVEVEALSRAIESYKLDPDFNFTYPTAANLYSELTGQGPVNRTKVFFEPPRSMVDTNSNPRRFIDPWGKAYIYVTNNPVNVGMFDLYSTAGQTDPDLYIRN